MHHPHLHVAAAMSARWAATVGLLVAWCLAVALACIALLAPLPSIVVATVCGGLGGLPIVNAGMRRSREPRGRTG